MTDERLAAKVRAVNKAHRAANDLWRQLRPIFEPLVGQQIVKKDGPLLEKIKKLVPPLPNAPDLQIHKNSSEYTLSYGVRANEYDCQGSLSHSVSVHIGDLQGGVLGKLYDSDVFRTDYTVEEILAKRAALKVAEKAYDDAKSALHPFGEYDR